MKIQLYHLQQVMWQYISILLSYTHKSNVDCRREISSKYLDKSPIILHYGEHIEVKMVCITYLYSAPIIHSDDFPFWFTSFHPCINSNTHLICYRSIIALSFYSSWNYIHCQILILQLGGQQTWWRSFSNKAKWNLTLLAELDV